VISSDNMISLEQLGCRNKSEDPEKQLAAKFACATRRAFRQTVNRRPIILAHPLPVEMRRRRNGDDENM
jgi:hypothetical protein